MKNRKEYKEGDTLDSTYPYDVSKSSSDLICQSYSKTYSMKVGIIRCGNIYGPGDFNLKRLIPEVILSTIENKNFIIRSNGKSTRDYVYVEDAVSAYIKVFNKLKDSNDELKIYNVSSKFNYSVLAIINMILKINIFPIHIRFYKRNQEEEEQQQHHITRIIYTCSFFESFNR